MDKESRLLANVRTTNLIVESVKARGLFAGDALALAKTTLVGLLDATVVVRGIERTHEGSTIYVERPDNAIRLAAAVKIIELETGKASQSIDVQHHDNGSVATKPEDAIKMLLKNPDLMRKAVTALIDGAKRAQVCDVTDITAQKPISPVE